MVSKSTEGTRDIPWKGLRNRAVTMVSEVHFETQSMYLGKGKPLKAKSSLLDRCKFSYLVSLEFATYMCNAIKHFSF